MKCQILFSEKNKKNISKVFLLKILPRLQSIIISFTVRKKYLLPCVPNKDSNQPARLHSLVSHSCPHEETASLAIQNLPSEDYDQTV